MAPAMISNLTERRVPQYLAVYLGAGWGIVQFIDFISTRYALSPRWTDLGLLAIVLLLPSVLLYTYHHGRPGPDQWQKTEKVFIPVNILILVVALTFVGAGTNLSAVTTRVKVTDEKGNTVERVVANKAYRKRVAMFAFDVADKNSAWLSLAAPMLAEFDLQQQQFIQPVSMIQMRQKLMESGFKDGTGVPLTLKRDIADERHIPYFVTGTITTSAGGVSANVQLYETATAKKLSEKSFTAANVMALADLISDAMMKDLNIPVISDAKPELPVTELTTQNVDAMKDFFESVRLIAWRNDYAGAKRLLDNATKLDPTFAYAQVQRWVTNMVSGDQATAKAAIQSAIDHSYRLPERMQQYVKVYYYEAQQDYPHAFGVLDMMSQLYPDDLEVLEQKVQVASIRDDKNGMVKTLRRIVEIDPSRTEVMLQLGQVYEQMGDAKNALAQYEAYAKKYPNEAKAARIIAILYTKTGEHAKAREGYERALLLKPNDVSTLISLATLDRRTGNFDGATENLNRALTYSKTSVDSSAAYQAFASLYDHSGQINASIKALNQSIEQAAKLSPPTQILWMQMMVASRSAKVDPARALAQLAALRGKIGPMLDLFAPLAELEVYWQQGNASELERAATALDQTIAKTSFAMYKSYALTGHGMAAELRGDCTSALKWYDQVQQLNPLDIDAQLNIGRCYRKSKSMQQAQQALAKVLKVSPANGEANLEMALLLKDSGDLAGAQSKLTSALRTWANADPNYKLAKQARELKI